MQDFLEQLGGGEENRKWGLIFQTHWVPSGVQVTGTLCQGGGRTFWGFCESWLNGKPPPTHPPGTGNLGLEKSGVSGLKAGAASCFPECELPLLAGSLGARGFSPVQG